MVYEIAFKAPQDLSQGRVGLKTHSEKKYQQKTVVFGHGTVVCGIFSVYGIDHSPLVILLISPISHQCVLCR